MPVRSGWLSPDGQSREDTRLVSLGALTPTSPVATRSGILPGSSNGEFRLSGFTLTGTSGTMSATISPGRAVVQSTDARGAYPVALTEYLPLVFADGNAQYDRIDLVVLRVHDDAYDGSGRFEAVVEIVQGTAAAIPVVPDVPGLSLPLYEVRVPANASTGTNGIPWSTALTGRRTATVAVGGILPVISDTAGGAYPGQYRDIDGQLQRWNGTAWTDYPVLPTWQSWTPTWTTNTGAATPSFGNATLSCRYVKFGTTVHLNFSITFGSTTTYGTSATTSDNWRFSLPVAASAVHPQIGFAELGAANETRAVARMYCGTTTTFEMQISTGRPNAAVHANYGSVDALTPWTWASGNTIRGTATYEAAS
ncbi:hypothetical protein [Streptomyces aurantiogriseus]|uniref:Minor tail protein n=1 Tax=Streptomyces aurantiogriseus TaxID=66870 RepID=A0A918BZM7_9ACTN|nr:hypothetical protein [Streptomyces aurantiogriseus]GGQ99502.1 hypothetical protein GCM10010251_13290 [Streptomyces aurantiogriseus]